MAASQVRNCVSINGFACRRFAPRNRTVVAADIWWRSLLLDQLLHDSPYALCIDKTIDMDEQTLARILIAYRQHLETATADRLIVDKIPAKNLARIFGGSRQTGGDIPSPAFRPARGNGQT